MATNPVTYRGESAVVKIGTTADSTLGLSDFSITLDRGTVEQELVGESGNYFAAGSLSVDGSLTGCKTDTTAAGTILEQVINGTRTTVSGSAGTNSLHFYFASCAITSFEITLGDADTITEASMDWTLTDPQNVTTVTQIGGSGTKISDA